MIQIIYTRPLYNFCLFGGYFFIPNKAVFNTASILLRGGKTNLFFSTSKVLLSTLFENSKKLLINYAFFSSFYGFNWFRFVLYSGLGYKRRFYKKYRIMFAYIGHRDWILYKVLNMSNIVPVKRRNYVFFSRAKGALLGDYNFFSSLNKKPPLYKMKGFLDARVKGRFLFVRRIKIRSIYTKLSKKQKLL